MANDTIRHRNSICTEHGHARCYHCFLSSAKALACLVSPDQRFRPARTQATFHSRCCVLRDFTQTSGSSENLSLSFVRSLSMCVWANAYHEEAGGREVEWGLRVDAGADQKLDGQKRENRATKVIGTCHAAHPTEGAWLKPLSVGVSGRSGDHSRDVIYPTSRDGPLGERPMVPGGRGRTQRKDELRHQMDVD